MVFSLHFLLLVSVCVASKLPIVDLGYELHQAFSFNSSLGLYNFSNIRYAAPPLGDLRFRAPALPTTNRSQVQNGSVGIVCPSAEPIWEEDIAEPFLLSILYNTTFNQSTNISSYPYTPPKLDPRTTEDCLFLDVVVPKHIFDRAQNKSYVPNSKLAPVLVWIYGGGYTMGDKSSSDASGLVHRSTVSGDGIIFVAMNYRLGAFGWLSGKSLTANGTANAALHDQRFALDWVYKNIHLFGGDSRRVTIMGESAGGGSVMHQITAYGGNAGPSPFQQAIVQSPGWVPMPEEKQQEQILQQFLSILNVTSVEEARRLPSKKLIAANAYQVGTKSYYGSYTYGPVVDGTFVPALPGQLLLEGNFDHNLNVMVGHNADEGLVFTSPASRNSSGLAAQLKQEFVYIRPNVTKHITQVLYPPIYDGTYGYTNAIQRDAFLVSELIFTCNTDYINRAFHNQTYAYEFSIPPALHGEDVAYTFYSDGAGASDSTVTNVTVAMVMQDWFTSFVQSGAPNSSLAPMFHRHGRRGQLMNIASHSIYPMRDPTNNPRCRFWQTAPYYEPS
ncbi:hypothetical protein N7510_009398 [Penicillium lagena]|uniref:uncharacterized protein n=1 Tax=Penicillium lagena TaxID=94218 RepID=UPI002541DB07|nr:uncharacterized protein N7510_009398 [Penicillium lagena]KAJ5606617.1 hypothetical protein N7510_009398 [Penicillium lagena]